MTKISTYMSEGAIESINAFESELKRALDDIEQVKQKLELSIDNDRDPHLIDQLRLKMEKLQSIISENPKKIEGLKKYVKYNTESMKVGAPSKTETSLNPDGGKKPVGPKGPKPKTKFSDILKQNTEPTK